MGDLPDYEKRRIEWQAKIDGKVKSALKGTTAYVFLVMVYVLVQHQQVLAMSPNEFGDFMAGMSALLVFYWLLFGYGLQRDQLALQSEQIAMQMEELKLQRQELHDSTLANREQAEQLRKQAEILDLQYRSVIEREAREAQPDIRILGFEIYSGAVEISVKNVGPPLKYLEVFSGPDNWQIDSLDICENFDPGHELFFKIPYSGEMVQSGRVVFCCMSMRNRKEYRLVLLLFEGKLQMASVNLCDSE